MWPLRLVFVASQPFYTLLQCPSQSSGVRRTKSDFDAWQDPEVLDEEQPQALLQYDRMVSQYRTPAQTRDVVSGYTRDDLHGLDDEDMYGEPGDRASSGAVLSAPKPGHGGESEQPDTKDSEEHGAHGASKVASKDARGEEVDQRTGHEYHEKYEKSFVHGRRFPEAHEEGAEHGKYPSTTSTVIALMLVGMMAMGMSIFYLVNYPDEDIQQVTWTILSSTISLFCAVLIFSALKAVMGICLGEKVGQDHHAAPDKTTIVFSFVHFILTFVLNQILMVLNKEHHFRLKAWATIGGHMTAFAAIESFGNVYHYSFSENWQGGTIIIALASVVMYTMAALASYVREGFLPKSEHHQESFREECDEAGSEYISLTIGLLNSLLVRHFITGNLPPIHGSPRNKTPSEIWQLFGWSASFSVMLVLFAYSARDLLHSKTSAAGWANLFQYILSMSAGWCLLSWGQWLFWSSVGETMGEADKMQARMIMAIAFSALVFSSIFIFDFIADHYATQSGLRALISTMALLLGLAWEAVFTLSIESISGHYIHNPTQYIWCELGLTFVLCGVVLPAWVLYFVPKAEEGKFLAEEQM